MSASSPQLARKMKRNPAFLQKLTSFTAKQTPTPNPLSVGRSPTSCKLRHPVSQSVSQPVLTDLRPGPQLPAVFLVNTSKPAFCFEGISAKREPLALSTTLSFTLVVQHCTRSLPTTPHPLHPPPPLPSCTFPQPLSTRAYHSHRS